MSQDSPWGHPLAPNQPDTRALVDPNHLAYSQASQQARQVPQMDQMNSRMPQVSQAANQIPQTSNQIPQASNQNRQGTWVTHEVPQTRQRQDLNHSSPKMPSKRTRKERRRSKTEGSRHKPPCSTREPGKQGPHPPARHTPAALSVPAQREDGQAEGGQTACEYASSSKATPRASQAPHNHEPKPSPPTTSSDASPRRAQADAGSATGAQGEAAGDNTTRATSLSLKTSEGTTERRDPIRQAEGEGTVFVVEKAKVLQTNVPLYTNLRAVREFRKCAERIRRESILPGGRNGLMDFQVIIRAFSCESARLWPITNRSAPS
ncbi:hypothetical protein WMY93_031940 [Mugilogobius chulae]|uniref:Uncharacterized protein n=1 Tax=Mugilogobius chulae TaxID=88201 RepID=A0AAW0MJS9_9GOBI